jgi:hypothetical protein
MIAVPLPHEGRFAVVTDVGSGMRWTRQCQAPSWRRRMKLQRTAKSCGPGAPTLALSSWTRTTNDGGKRARSPGRSRISRNTIVQGMPVDAVYLWLLTPVLFCCTGGYGCNAHPAFPAPSVEEGGRSRIKLAQNMRRDRDGVAARMRRGGLFDSLIGEALAMG